MLAQPLAGDEGLAGLEVRGHGLRLAGDTQLQSGELPQQRRQSLQQEEDPLAGDHPRRAEDAGRFLLAHCLEEQVIHRVFDGMHARRPQPGVSFQDVGADGDQVLHTAQGTPFKPAVQGAGHPSPPDLQGLCLAGHDAVHGHHGRETAAYRRGGVNLGAVGVHHVRLQRRQGLMQPLDLRPMPGQPPQAWLRQAVDGQPWQPLHPIVRLCAPKGDHVQVERRITAQLPGEHGDHRLFAAQDPIGPEGIEAEHDDSHAASAPLSPHTVGQLCEPRTAPTIR